MVILPKEAETLKVEIGVLRLGMGSADVYSHDITIKNHCYAWLCEMNYPILEMEGRSSMELVTVIVYLNLCLGNLTLNSNTSQIFICPARIAGNQKYREFDNSLRTFPRKPNISHHFNNSQLGNIFLFVSQGARFLFLVLALSAMVLYQSSLVLPYKRATMITVILSCPLESPSGARQASMRSSQILWSSFRSTICPRTNSTTSSFDHQIPSNS